MTIIYVLGPGFHLLLPECVIVNQRNVSLHMGMMINPKQHEKCTNFHTALPVWYKKLEWISITHLTIFICFTEPNNASCQGSI